MADSSNRFETTRWSLVLSARKEGAEGRVALEELCRNYRPPLVAFALRMGAKETDAEDLVQGFFLSLLKSGSLARADPERGKLRTFLLTAFRRHAKDEWVKQRAAKRGAGAEHVSYDETRDLEMEETSPVEFDRDWAQHVMARSLLRLEERYQAEGKPEVFKTLRPCLAGDLPKGGHGELAEKLEVSAGAAKVALHRIRKRFGEALREEVADTLSEEENVEEEIRFLLRVVAT